MAVDVGEAQGRLTLDTSQYNAALKTASDTTNRTFSGMNGTASSSAKKIGDSFTRVGTAMSIGLTVPLVAAGKKMWDVAADFEASMSQVAAISGATGSEFDGLRDKAIQLGRDTVFSSSEVAEAMTEMAKAGWNANDIIGGMEGVLDAASASGENLSSVATIMANSITTFNLSAEDSAHVADVLTEAANSGTISISDLGESLKYIGPAAATAGFSFEDVNTALLAMSQSGIKGSQAGTSLRTMFVNLVKPTEQMAAAMDELGIEITNQDGTFKSLDDILAQLRTSMSGMTDEQKAYYSSILAGKTGLSGMLSLMNMSQEEYDQLAASIDNCGGVADETAAIMQDNLKNDVEQLTGSLESMAITLMKNLEPMLRKVVQALEKAVDWFTGLDPAVQTAAVAIAALVAAAGPLLVILGAIVSGAQNVNMALGTITKAFQALFNLPGLFAQIGKAAGTAFSAITSPVGIVVAVVAALVAAFVTLWNTSEEFRNNITNTFNTIVSSVQGFVQGIIDRFAAIGITWDSIVQGLSDAWNAFCTMLQPIFEGAFSAIAVVLQTVFDVLAGILDIFIGLFTGNWDQFWQGIQEVFSGIWNGIVGIFQTVWNTIVGIVDAFLSLLGTDINTVMTNIATFFSNVWNTIVTTVQTVWNGIVTTITTVMNAIWTTIQSIWNFIVTTITNVLNTIWTTIQNVWNTIVNTITTVMNNIWNTIQSIWNTIVNTVTSVVNSIWNTIRSVFNSIRSTISSVMNSIWSTIQSIWNTILSVVSGVINSIWSAVSGAFNNVVSTISNAMNSAKNAVSTAINNILNFFRNLPGNILSALGNVGNFLWNAGSSIINGLWNGLKSAAQGMFDWVGGIANTIASLKGPIPYDKKVLVPNGIALMSGLGAGLEDGFSDVEKQVSGMSDDIASAMSKDVGTIPVEFNATLNKVEGTTVFDDMEQKLGDMSKYAKDLQSDFAFEPQYNTYYDLDYELLATKLADVMRNAPIQANVDVSMTDGDVIMDSERVGRKVAPVVSRVQARGVKKQ